MVAGTSARESVKEMKRLKNEPLLLLVIIAIILVQGAEEPGKNEPSPAISQTTAPKTGLADPYVFVPLGIAAVTALGTVKLSRKEKKERRKKL